VKGLWNGLLPYPDTVAGSFNVALHDPRWISCHERTRRHVTRDEARGGNDAIIPNRYSWQYHCVSANETVVADVHVTMQVVYPVVRENCCAKGYHRVFANVNSLRIGFVEFGAGGNLRAFANVHVPELGEVLAPDFLTDYTQRVPNSSRERNSHSDVIGDE
jgi:hypothetical protein